MRRLLTIVFVLSPLLCLGTGVLLALDRGTTMSREVVLAVPPDTDLAVVLFHGQVFCGQLTAHPRDTGGWDFTIASDSSWSLGMSCGGGGVGRYGAHFLRHTNAAHGSTGTTRGIQLPQPHASADQNGARQNQENGTWLGSRESARSCTTMA